MTIQETVIANVYIYDHTESDWALLETLNDTSVISASVTSQCSSENAPEIGGVYSSCLRMTARITATISGFILKGGKITLFHTIGTDSQQQIGVFYITQATRKGGKNSTIFDITALDAVGWLDTSSKYYIDQEYDGSRSITAGADLSRRTEDPTTGSAWYVSIDTAFLYLTNGVNEYIYRAIGIPTMVSWSPWDSVDGTHINQRTWESYETQYTFSVPIFNNRDEDEHGEKGERYLAYGANKFDSDIPRTIYQQFAQAAGGFIYALPTGQLKLGQYCGNGRHYLNAEDVESYDTRTINYHSAGLIEEDGFDYSNFSLSLDRFIVRCENSEDGAPWWEMTYLTDWDYSTQIYYNWEISANIFMNMAYYYGLQTAGWTFKLGHGISARFRNYTYTDFLGVVHNVPVFRPFSARVFPTSNDYVPFLGADVIIDNVNDTDIHSTVTKIVWTLHGGYKISCAGSDSRTLIHSVNVSGSQKVQHDMLTWIRGIGG